MTQFGLRCDIEEMESGRCRGDRTPESLGEGRTPPSDRIRVGEGVTMGN